MTAPPRLALSVREVAELLGVHRNTIYLQIKRGTIPVVYVGTKPLVPRKWIVDRFGGR
jgi:excisionase family DNA binding protein